MRIDYSEPRQSYGSSSSSTGASPRKADSSSSGSLLLWSILAGVIFITGFGTGWFFSQKAAKKAFRAAMEQQSLETALKDPKKQTEQPVQQPAQPGATAPAAAPGQPAQSAAPTGQVPLSFFESLPKGQKQTVLGSGINEKPKPAPSPAPQPPQAAGAAAKAPDSKTAGSGFLVQVASFTNAKEAENAKAKLAAKGYSATVAETNLNDKGTWYRLRIGRHLDKEAAAEIASRVGGGAKVLPDQE
ncbi:SPOR domain-containing protein [Trichlorobacter lovleyi]|uniref:SPOR domain-containing protein n=1 Tax=Trichlorobacter lovleyi TaxID=313985 RepID=UPI0022405F5E|nr:SPOR domain-containing protein [Trichlorobacter lovleyi]QOX78297.1 SPOR domain-containing protein [Trichlorobacter lovleyi]